MNRDRLPVPDGAPTVTGSVAHRSPAPRALAPDVARRHRLDERTRVVTAGTVAVLGLAALLSVLPTPVHGVLGGLFGSAGAVGPVTIATSVVFWSVGLVLVARGLRFGHRLAWAVTLVYCGAGILAHLLRHDDVTQTALLVLGGALMIGLRKAFPVAVSTSRVVASVASVAVTLGTGALAGVVWHQHHRRVGVDPSWLHGAGIGLAGPVGFGGGPGPAAVLGSALLVLVVVLWRRLSPTTPPDLTELSHHLQRERARELVAAHGGGTLDYFALRDDKQWFFHGRSVVAYAVRYGVCLVSPDPVGPAEERFEVWGAFLAHVRAHGWSVSVLGAAASWVDVYRRFGLRPLYLGDEAIVDCTTFTLEGRAVRGLRQACHRVERAGYTVDLADPATLDARTRDALLQVARVSRVGEAERGFSMTLSRLFDPADTGLMMSIARDQEGVPRAFVQWTPAADIGGWSLDVMRYDTGPDVPNGLMDHLIVRTIEEVARRGGTGLGLNFAVVRDLVVQQATTPMGRVGQRVLHAVSGRTEIASLGRYNEKFGPRWQRRYVVLDRIDTIARQGLVIAAAEGLSELPVIGRFMGGVER